MLNVREATVNDIQLIRQVTSEVWPATYSSILSPEQINYMLEMMYSESSLQKQMNKLQHHFLLCYYDDLICGFASYNFLHRDVFKLQKIYILSSFQGRGAGILLLETIYKKIKILGGEKLILNVNRNNPAVNFYKKLGFSITGEEDIDIGNGFFMNDYIMSKEII